MTINNILKYIRIINENLVVASKYGFAYMIYAVMIYKLPKLQELID